MNKKSLISKYSDHYKEKKIQNLYPTEFVIRSFLGTYPELKPAKKETFFGKKILDSGCGDGRNIPFLKNLGFKVYGTEIDKSIIDICNQHLILNNSKAELFVGKNNKIPFESKFFDYVVACHSCYYLDENDLFSDNLNEIHRVLKKFGRFVFSIPKANNYLVEGGEIIEGNYAIIKNDPLGIRNGTKIKFFDSENEIKLSLDYKFDSFKIGYSENNWWGNKDFYWNVVCASK